MLERKSKLDRLFNDLENSWGREEIDYINF